MYWQGKRKKERKKGELKLIASGMLPCSLLVSQERSEISSSTWEKRKSGRKKDAFLRRDEVR